MADDFNKNMQIIMGKSAQRDVELSADDKKNLSTAYQKLFANLTYNHWLRGGTLGKAWYNTLTQMKQFIQSMGTSGPAAMYLRQMFASHSAEWAKVMMTNPNRETVLDVDEKSGLALHAGCETFGEQVDSEMGARLERGGDAEEADPDQRHGREFLRPLVST